MKLTSHSPAETQEIAARVAKRLGVNVIALEGELGVGKTTFVKGFARALGVKQKITSPTFVIMKSYKLKAISYKLLYHIDAYRLKDHRELEKLGVEELFNDPENIVLIEWSDRVRQALPEKYISVHIDHLKERKRLIKISDV